jgi:anti-sigma factor RsiW
VSARPSLARLSEEELDLLISRSLDGDLPPEEEQELQRHLAADPEARRRHEATAALVERVQTLPSAEPPFALATRVNSQVGERTSGIGSVWHRFGLYPPPGAVGALVAVLALVVGTWAFIGGPKKRTTIASKDEGPVRVFFQRAAPDSEAAPAPSAATDRLRAAAAKQTNERALRDEKGARAEAEEAQTREDRPQKVETVDQAAASGLQEQAKESKLRQGLEKKKADLDAGQNSVSSTGFAPVAPSAPSEPVVEEHVRAKTKDAGQPAAMAAPAAPVPAGAVRAEVARRARPEVAVVTGPWKLVSTPGPLDTRMDAKYRLRLDDSGRVIEVKGAAPPADVDRLLRALVFERAGEGDQEVEVRLVTR